ncbi:hypothetical protein ACR77J_08010 [Tissierella praeacuta]|uniref:hypothetical protein n=1 Tax=Tissierella praeacuta TaxID=43131 RepID=UPI003DA64CA9
MGENNERFSSNDVVVKGKIGKFFVPSSEKLIVVGKENKSDELFKQYQERYDFDFNQEFYVKELIKTKIQFENTPDEYVRTKLDLMRLILELERNLKLKEKVVINQCFDDYKILIATDNLDETHDIFMNGLYPEATNTVAFRVERKNGIRIVLLTGVTIDIIKISPKFNGKPNIDQYRGFKCNKYINLTNNEDVEDWLKTTVVK